MSAISTSRRMLRSRLAAYGLVLLAVLFVYGVLAYVALPAAWSHYEHQKGLAGLPMVTRTAQDIPGDPMNVGLVGTQEDVVCAVHAAQWHPADPITLRSSLAIIGSVMLDRPYLQAPVSPLFYEGRREDLAFEKAEGQSADRRHHVRLWKVLRKGEEGRSVWLGAATFDRGVGFNRFTGQVTHHIAPDIDAERDFLTGTLEAAKVVEAVYEVTGIGPTLDGVNGEGDPYQTDGEIKISRLAEGCGTRVATPRELANPPVIVLKNLIWQVVLETLLARSTPAEDTGSSGGSQDKGS
ncbi:MAG: LssY C-terminal domain-containing protein [Hyphomicrobiales bacterium]|nr:LssY C-terminal domain-containing protein [Hyphomicrobiales bacterium]